MTEAKHSLGLVLRGSGWLAAGNGIATVLAFVQSLIVARLLGPEGLGLLALVVTFAGTVNQFLDSRVWETAIKFATRYRTEGRNAEAAATLKVCYAVDAVTGMLAFIIVFFASDLAARLLLGDPANAYLIRLYAFYALINIPLGTSTAIVRLGDRFDWLGYHSAAVAAIRLVGVLTVGLMGVTVGGLLAAYLAAIVASTVGMVVLAWIVARRLELTDHIRAPLSLLKGQTRPLTRFLVVANASAIVKLLQRNADVLLVGYWMGPRDVGFLRIARTVADLMTIPVSPIYSAAYPEFARLWHRGKSNALRALAGQLTTFSSAIAAVGLLLLTTAAAPFVGVVFGAEYLSAVPLLRWLVVGTAVAVAITFGHPLLLSIGQERVALAAATAGAFLQLVILVVSIPALGLTGVGIAYLGLALAMAAAMAMPVRRFWNDAVRDVSPTVEVIPQ